jgi:phenylalanyl-tRNA synthetase beta chain
MKVPVSWLREYVEVSATTQQIADRLAIATGEVERIVRRGVADENGNYGLFKVGRVIEAGKHPNADRLQLCRVDVGEAEPRQIVCGAWNFGPGATVAVALPGAVLPDGNMLEQAKLRGEVSDGMILSESELELGSDHSGILVLSDPIEPGTPLADVLPLGEEVLEIEMTRNRPDCLSVYGIAREVAALFSGELAAPPGRDPGEPGSEPPDVTIEDYEGCPRYVGRLFTNVAIAPSPPWLKARITAAGMRPISNVVDVTNYVMLATGNPLHAFDFDTLRGGKIVVRRAHKGEEFTTLDGNLRKLVPEDLVIADAEGAIAFAGIMGGEDTEVREGTTSILLEAANFEPIGILRSSERHALRTEGSNRWEKGVDPHLAPQAAALATELILELTGAQWAGHVDAKGELPDPPVVSLRTGRVNRVVGLEIPPDDQRGALERLGFDVSSDWKSTVPTWRAVDVTREIDLVEEVARVHGLEKIPFTLPTRSAMFGTLAPDQRLRRLVEDVLVGAGFSEAYTLSLAASDSDEKRSAPRSAHLRARGSPHDAPGRPLVAAARHNVNMGNEAIRLFEIARVYLPSGEELPEERRPRSRGSPRAASRRPWRCRDALRRPQGGAGLRAHDGAFLHPGKGGARSGRLGRRAPPEHSRRGVGGLRARPRDAPRAPPERIVYEDVITFPALARTSPSSWTRARRQGTSSAATARRPGRTPRHARLRRLPRRGHSRGPKVDRVSRRVPLARPHALGRGRPELREKIVAALGSAVRGGAPRMSPQADTVVFSPALNEEESSPGVLDELRGELPGVDVLVVDDGSRDRTPSSRGERGRGAELSGEPRACRGRRGRYEYAARKHYAYCGRVDADGQHPPQELTACSSAFAPEGVRRGRSVRASSRATATSRTATSRARRAGWGPACCGARSGSSSDGRSPMRRAGMYAAARPPSRSRAALHDRGAPRSRASCDSPTRAFVVEEVRFNMRERAAGESRISGKKAVSLVSP